MNNQWFSKIAVWLVIALVLFTVFKQLDKGVARADAIGYSEFLGEVNAGRIASVQIQEGPGNIEIIAKRTDGGSVRTLGSILDRGLTGDLIRNNVKFEVKAREEQSLLMTILISWGPFLLLQGQPSGCRD